jgi:NAD(P)-dependent dehydrogenase (short-subunit alcohol dehydrogenase family)
VKDFAGKLAVVTGGGTGIGRELARQLTAQGCSVALCDLSETAMAETIALATAGGLPRDVRITAHQADVSLEDDLIRVREAASAVHATDRLHLLFNNAGIGGGGSMVDPRQRADWERTFNVCWGGVYLGVRTFLPMLQAAEAAHIVNIASVNGFWACLGPQVPHTAYAAAKFAVKGFTEALIVDLRVNAPHIGCSVVMPGHIGTPIAGNSRKVLRGVEDEALTAEELSAARRFLEEAPTSAAQAATIILAGVKAARWRILVGEDAAILDRMVRETPEAAYEQEFYDRMAPAAGWRLGGPPKSVPG